MLIDWSRPLQFRCDWETFQQLPRQAAYRYEYQNGCCTITFRPVYYHARVALERVVPQHFDFTTAFDHTRCFVSLADVPEQEIVAVFADALSRMVLFETLDAPTRLQAAQEFLTQALTDQSGLYLPAASWCCFTEDLSAEDPQTSALQVPSASPGDESEVSASSQPELIGGVVVTLFPSADFIGFRSEDWLQTVPEDAFSRGWGQPHLTWIFVKPRHRRRYVAQHLLRTAAASLKAVGYETLMSTMLLGNEASLLWHWRMGFELLPHPASPSRLLLPESQ